MKCWLNTTSSGSTQPSRTRRVDCSQALADRTPRWAKAAGALFVSATMLIGVVPAGALAAPANPAPVGGGFTVTPGDLSFILSVAGPQAAGCAQDATITFRANDAPVTETATNDLADRKLIRQDVGGGRSDVQLILRRK